MTLAPLHTGVWSGAEPVTLAFVGVGRYGTHLGQDGHGSPLIQIGGCFDPRPEAMARFAERFGGRTAGSFEELLDLPGLDGVVIASPNVDHRRSALMALSAQKHVFIEKPITTTVGEATELIQLARQVKRVLMVGHNSRRAHPVRQLHALIHGGALGSILSFEGNFSTPSHQRLDPSHWAYRRDSMPGGALLEGGIHLIDICNYLFGPAIAVSALLRRRVTPGECEDVCMALCRHRAPGDTADGYFTDFPANIVSLTTAPAVNFLRVCGSQATATILGRKAELSVETADGHPGPADIETEFDALNGQSTRRQELDEFAFCIRQGATPETDGVCGLHALAVVEAAVLSNGKGAEVALDDLGLAF